MLTRNENWHNESKKNWAKRQLGGKWTLERDSHILQQSILHTQCIHMNTKTNTNTQHKHTTQAQTYSVLHTSIQTHMQYRTEHTVKYKQENWARIEHTKNKKKRRKKNTERELCEKTKNKLYIHKSANWKRKQTLLVLCVTRVYVKWKI